MIETENRLSIQVPEPEPEEDWGVGHSTDVVRRAVASQIFSNIFKLIANKFKSASFRFLCELHDERKDKTVRTEI